MVRYWLLILLLPLAASAQTPIDWQTWKYNDTSFRSEIGGVIRNYQRADSSWADIDNRFHIEGDSVAYVNTAALKVRVDRFGVSTVTFSHGGNEYVASQRLIGVGWINTSTTQHLWIDSVMNWSNVSVGDSSISWTNVSPGINYQINKEDGALSHLISFKPAFLDSAVTPYNQRMDSTNIALANLMVYTLSSNCDDADSAIGDVSWRQIKEFGRVAFSLTRQTVQYPSMYDAPHGTLHVEVPVRQYWKRVGEKIYCIEYVKFSHLKRLHEQYPSEILSHNTRTEITSTSNIEDIGMYSSTNWAGQVTHNIWNEGTSYVGRVLLRIIGLNTSLAAARTVTSCSLHVYIGSVSGGSTFDVHEIFKYKFVHDGSGIGRDYWDAGNTYDWGAQSAEATNDAGSRNTLDDDGDDRTATADGTATNWNSTADHYISLSTSMTGMQSGDTLTFIIKGRTSSEDIEIALTENTNAAKRPSFIFNWTAGGAPETTPNYRRRRLIIMNSGGN